MLPRYWWTRSPSSPLQKLHGGRKQAEAFVDEVEKAERSNDAAFVAGVLDRQWLELTGIARLALGDAAP